MKPPPQSALHLTLGLTVWIAWLALIYAGLTVSCVIVPPDPAQGANNWLNVALGIFTLAVFAALLWYARGCWRAARRGDDTDPRSRFLPTVGAALHLIGAISALFIGLTLLRLPPCI